MPRRVRRGIDAMVFMAANTFLGACCDISESIVSKHHQFYALSFDMVINRCS
jgi:hypothetical protein